MSDPVVVYGATGYTGGVVVRRLCDLGLRPVLSGRSPAKLARLAEDLGLEHRVADLTAPSLQEAFADARVVVNAAGPFSRTADPIAQTCLRTGSHYLDLTAEAPVAELLARHDREAAARGVMIMPAIGFNVVTSDCLARHLAARLTRIRHLAVAVTQLAFLTRGSVRTLLGAVDASYVRRNGALARVPYGSLVRSFDFGAGTRSAMNISLADAATGYYSVGAPEIDTYVEATPMVQALLVSAGMFGPLVGSAPSQALLATLSDLLPEGSFADPTRVTEHAMHVVVEAEDHRGRRAAVRMHTPEAYSFSGTTAGAIVQRALAGDVEHGFQTPGRVYGSDFVLAFEGVSREDIA